MSRDTGLRIGQVAGLTWGDFDDDWEGLGPALHIRVAKTEADLLVTSCPACIVQLRHGVRRRGMAVRVAHLSQLVPTL